MTTKGSSGIKEAGRVQRRICSLAMVASLVVATVFILANANAVAKMADDQTEGISSPLPALDLMP